MADYFFARLVRGGSMYVFNVPKDFVERHRDFLENNDEVCIEIYIPSNSLSYNRKVSGPFIVKLSKWGGKYRIYVPRSVSKLLVPKTSYIVVVLHPEACKVNRDDGL